MKKKDLSRNNIGLLCCLIILILFLPVMSSDDVFMKSILFTAVIFFGTFSLDFVERAQKLLIVSGTITICLNWIAYFIDNDKLFLVFAFSFFFFNLFIVLIMIRHVARSEKVNFTIILNSINGYLLLGILGALCLSITEIVDKYIHHLDSGTINFAGGAAKGFHDYLYFSFITLTTLGYGDVTPVSHLAKSVTMTIAVTGQFYMTILVAILVGKYLNATSEKP
ncbi:MAG: potassium channel family protein [Deltaproteobacteria bacterium]|nr:potassium channel family protein [Deltaproteobacteria bacterium]NNK86378.1 two pore domain potassium channel family protein [Desulfobacterales bacterium]